MTVKWMSIGLFFAGALGAAVFGYSLVQQTKLQGNINAAMQVINQSMAATGQLVQETSETLEPLYDTTKALAGIEEKEEQVVKHIAAMNVSLTRVASSEEGIVSGLDSLNRVTLSASSELSGMTELNSGILQSSSLSAQQSSQEGNQVKQLNQLTHYSIEQLKQLNEKLYLLRKLP